MQSARPFKRARNDSDASSAAGATAGSYAAPRLDESSSASSELPTEAAVKQYVSSVPVWRLPVAGPKAATAQKGLHWTLPRGASWPEVPRPRCAPGKRSTVPTVSKGICERCGLTNITAADIEVHLQTSLDESKQQKRQRQEENKARQKSDKPAPKLPVIIQGCDGSLAAIRASMDGATGIKRDDFRTPKGGDKFGDVLPPPAPGQPDGYFVVRASFPIERLRNLYWLYAVIPQRATLATLDDLLRWAWVDCCSHLSSFRLANATSGLPQFFREAPPASFLLEDSGFALFTDERARLDIVFAALAAAIPGRESYSIEPPIPHLIYYYDFGTITELMIEVVGRIDSPDYVPRGAAEIIAHNLAAAEECEMCRKATATHCYNDPKAARDSASVCQRCIESKCTKINPECVIILSTSPRMGSCRYIDAGL